MYYQQAIREVISLSLPQFSVRVLLRSYYEICVRDIDRAWHVVSQAQMPRVSSSIPGNKNALVSGKRKLSPCFG